MEAIQKEKKKGKDANGQGANGKDPNGRMPKEWMEKGGNSKGGEDLTESRGRYRGCRGYFIFADDKGEELGAIEAPKRVCIHASDQSK